MSLRITFGLLLLIVVPPAFSQINFSTDDRPVVPRERTFRQLEASPLQTYSSTTLLKNSQKSTRPIPLFQGLPLIQTKGIVKGDKFLYIADTGKDSKHNEPARIWKFDPSTRELKLFYQGPLLVNAKWLFYRAKTKTSPAELFISDYGVETSARAPGTGEGAKVFAVPLDDKGDALEPRVLHAGAPLRSPEGITVVGDTVVLADWAAGEERSLPDRNGKFLSGSVFLIPVAGGPPKKMFNDHTWVTLIGACRYWGEDGLMYIRFIDLDSGRPDRSPLAYLPQSGTVEFYRARVLRETPLELGTLERVVLKEDLIVGVSAAGLEAGDSVIIKALKGETLIGNRKFRVTKTMGSTNTFQIPIESDVSEANVELSLDVLRGGKLIANQIISKPKELTAAIMRDNKHGGARVRFSNETRLIATADGTTKGVYLVQPKGGVPASLWRGAPLNTPMGVQYSWDESRIWVTDQEAGHDGTSAIFEILLPSKKDMLKIFPAMKLQKKVLQ